MESRADGDGVKMNHEKYLSIFVNRSYKTKCIFHWWTLYCDHIMAPSSKLEERLNSHPFPKTIRFRHLDNGAYPLVNIHGGISSANGKQWRSIRVVIKIDDEETITFLPSWQAKIFTDEFIRELRGYQLVMVKDRERISWKIE